MKAFFDFLLKENTWDHWLWFGGIVIAFTILGKIMLVIEKKYLREKVAKTATRVDDLFINVFQLPFVCSLILFGIYLAIQTLVLPDYVEPILEMSFKVLVLLNIAWIINRLIKNVLNNFLLPYATENKDSKLDINVIKAIQKVSSSLIWIVALITALTFVGIDVAAMLTTLGIGGIAFALAAQDTIKNMFGGFTIFVDRPFTIYIECYIIFCNYFT